MNYIWMTNIRDSNSIRPYHTLHKSTSQRFWIFTELKKKNLFLEACHTQNGRKINNSNALFFFPLDVNQLRVPKQLTWKYHILLKIWVLWVNKNENVYLM